MSTLAKSDEQVEDVQVTKDVLIVDLMDGRSISVPLDWYPKLQKATAKQRNNWEISSAGYGIHWPEIDEDLSTEGLLRGSPSPVARIRKQASKKRIKKTSKRKTRHIVKCY